MAVASLGDYERLLRFGQMHVGPRIPPGLSDWKTIPGGPSLRLAAHPRLNVVQVECHPCTLTLVGYLIDPEHPGRDDRQILAGRLGTAGFPEAPFELRDRLGGRWLLVLDSPTDTSAFSDPGGLRRFYWWPGDASPFAEVIRLPEWSGWAVILARPLLRRDATRDRTPRSRTGAQ